MLPEGYIKNYEEIAYDYGTRVSTETEAIARLVDYSIQLLGIPYDAAVLDVGCGNGWMLSNMGCLSLTGLDISHANCRQTRQLSTLHKVVQADAQVLPLQDQSFDVVICCDLYEHVPNTTLLVEEIHRVLRPGGVLLFCCPFDQDLSYYESPSYHKKYRYVHLRSVDRDMLRQSFVKYTKLAEMFITSHMSEQESPYPIIFQVYAKRG